MTLLQMGRDMDVMFSRRVERAERNNGGPGSEQAREAKLSRCSPVYSLTPLYIRVEPITILSSQDPSRALK
jgi:hypothetical protein